MRNFLCSFLNLKMAIMLSPKNIIFVECVYKRPDFNLSEIHGHFLNELLEKLTRDILETSKKNYSNNISFSQPMLFLNH